MTMRLIPKTLIALLSLAAFTASFADKLDHKQKNIGHLPESIWAHTVDMGLLMALMKPMATWLWGA